MPLRIGCDLVQMPSFQRQFIRTEPRGLETVFWPAEYTGQPLESLAGIFAAKEAVCKALSMPLGLRLDLCVEDAPSGEPLLRRVRDLPEVETTQVSIAHAGDHALACVLVQTR